MTLAIFDFDGTMIRGDSVVSYLFFARKQRLLSAGRLLWAGLFACLFRLGLTDAGRAKSAALAFRKDVPAEKQELYSKYYWKPVHSQIRVPKTKWVILRYPLPSMAQQADMSTEAFEDFFFNPIG